MASPGGKALFKGVDKAVRKGIINGTPTEEIADVDCQTHHAQRDRGR